MSETMRAIRWYAPRDMRLVEVPKPKPGPDDALIRIESTGVCGSDMHYYAEGRIGSNKLREPVILGHEFAGVVEAVGENADQALIGKRVAVEPGIPCGDCEWCKKGRYNVCPGMRFPGGPGVDGSLCDFVAVPAASCHVVPETFTPAVAAMIEPLAVAVHSLELADVEPGSTVAVLGLGPIGLLTAMVAKTAGAQLVFGTDLHDYRVEASIQFGVDDAFHAEKMNVEEAVLDATNGRGVDVVFDCARSAVTPSLACKLARPGGTCIMTGISGNDEDLFHVGAARRKELTITWCRRFLFNFPASIAMADEGTIDLERLITHHFPLEQAPEAFALVYEARDGVLKASIENG